MKIHLTRAVAFAPVYRYLEENGATVARDLETVRISPEAVAYPEALIPLEHCARFVEHSACRYGLEDLGLRAGSAASIGDFGLFGDVLKRALTLNDLINRFIQWVPLADSGAKARAETDRKANAVRFWIDHEVGVSRALVNEYGLMILIDAVRLALGPDWRPTVVWMPRPSGRPMVRYEALSDATIHFHACAGLEIPLELLGTPNLPNQGRRSALPEVEQAFHQSGPPSNPVDMVNQAVRSGIGHKLPSLDEIAELAGVSARAVQRRLRSSGTSYRELVDRVRFEESVGMLEDESVPITEIAYRLGYGEISNFTHAFVRWSGRSPTEYREAFLGRE